MGANLLKNYDLNARIAPFFRDKGVFFARLHIARIIL